MITKLVTKLLFQVLVRKIYNSTVSPQEEGELKELRDFIIISDSTFCNILPPQLKKMTARYKLMCGCECFISAKIMNSSLITCIYYHLEKPKDRSHNVQNRRYGEISSCIFETYKNYVLPHGFHIYNTTACMTMEKFAPVPLNIMGYRTVNVCYIVVISSKVFSYPVRSQIKMQQTCVQKQYFMFTVIYHVVLCTADVHTKNKKHVQCVPHFQYLTVLPKYTHEKNL